MNLTEEDCWSRLTGARHGVLSTVHPERGVDVVPVVFAVDGPAILLPIDTVKPKAGRRLQRLTNLDADARCVLLVEHYEEDWSRLWWVRVHGRGAEEPLSPDRAAVLAARYPAYLPTGAVASVIVLHPSAITGWAGGSP